MKFSFFKLKLKFLSKDLGFPAISSKISPNSADVLVEIQKIFDLKLDDSKKNLKRFVIP